MQQEPGRALRRGSGCLATAASTSCRQDSQAGVWGFGVFSGASLLLFAVEGGLDTQPMEGIPTSHDLSPKPWPASDDESGSPKPKAGVVAVKPC